MTMGMTEPFSTTMPKGYVGPPSTRHNWNASFDRVHRVVIATQSICPTLERLQNGDLLAGLYSWVFRQGEREFAVKLTRSKDGGLTWSEPTILAGPPEFKFAHSHHGMTQISNGTILYPFNAQDQGRLSSWLTRSTDNGHSWSQPAKISPEGAGTGPDLRLTCCYGKIREFTDGQVILPIWGSLNGEMVNGFFKSPDGGETWNKFVTVSRDFGGETDYMELPDGRFIAVMRIVSHEGHGMAPLYWCYSEDGEQWDKPKPAWNMYGHSPCLFLTNKGRLMCAYRYVGDLDTGIVGVSFSILREPTDNIIPPYYWSLPNHIWLGSTWGTTAAWKINRCGYPSIVQVDSNRILCVYCMSWTLKSIGGADTPVLYMGYAHDVEGVFFDEEEDIKMAATS